MPLPNLGNVGNMLGGLANVGASGAGGGLEGMVEGEKLKRLFQSQDFQNQLAQLRMQMEQQKLNQPVPHHPGTVLRDPRTGALTQLPSAPLTDLEQAQAEAQRAHAGLYRSQMNKAEIPPAPSFDQKKAEIVSTYLQMLKEQGPEAAKAYLAQSLGAIEAATRHPSQTGLAPHYSTDAQGNKTAVMPQPDGTFKTVPLGRIGMPQRQPAGAGGKDRLTVEESIKPKRPITNIDDMGRLNAALPAIITELSSKPGFNVPGAYVRLPNGMNVRKEDIIARYVKDKLGVDVKVQWEGKPYGSGFLGSAGGGAFKIVKAWEPEQVLEKRRTTGPPPSQRPAPAEDEEED
jgi:hypothetical protein